jgi:NAD(P)-dependent dehydrogenase (short-subunit alcohol dehydrogenase family)
MNFTGKLAVVTGGTNGIGKSIVEAFRKAGARVSVIDKDENSCDCDFFFHGDIAGDKVLAKFVSQVIEKFGSVDYLINNAMLSKKGIFSGCSYKDFLYVQRIGVAAPYLLTKLLLPHFTQGAAIVNICSTRAFMSQADTESYSAAKGGIQALTHALAASLAGKVRVNAISPGWIDTTGSEWSREDHAQHPAGRVGTPADIANMALFLCSEESSFIPGRISL